jgi:hypothetical protein
MLGYEELSELSGRSVGALRVARSKGRLPEPDAPGPRWRRESLAALLKEGAPVPAGGPSVAREPRSGPGPSTATPERSEPATAAPVPSRPPFAGDDAEDRRRRSMTITDVLACPHPPEDLKRLPYMVMCVRCGRRQEGRDRFTGGGYAAWAPGWRQACPHPEGERVARPWGLACLVCGQSVRG